MYHRIGAAAYKADLNNTIELCNLLENPQKSFKSVHIAGTNGKGSTSHMLAAICQKAGYKTALYTSPHLKDFRERVRINGQMIPESDVISFVKKFRSEFEKIGLSFFEWTVGLAFHYFANEKVDIAIIETGLGGRLDSTNIINPELSIITNISFDHMQLLGNTLEKIAFEKAGIIKDDVPVVIGEKQIEAEEVFKKKANETNSPISFASEKITATTIRKSPEEFIFDIYSEGNLILPKLKLSLTGNYQKKNICTVIESVLQLRNCGYTISDDNVRDALGDVQGITGLKGRWEKLSDSPLTICDVGHNEAGIEFILSQLKEYKFKQLRMVIGVVNDKDISKILELLPRNAEYYFCKANIPRALDAEELRILASGFGLSGKSYSSVQNAILTAKNESSADDLIFIGGSTFVVAEC